VSFALPLAPYLRLYILPTVNYQILSSQCEESLHVSLILTDEAHTSHAIIHSQMVHITHTTKTTTVRLFSRKLATSYYAPRPITVKALTHTNTISHCAVNTLFRSCPCNPIPQIHRSVQNNIFSALLLLLHNSTISHILVLID